MTTSFDFPDLPVITEMLNPVTRSVIRLNPPFHAESADHFDQFQTRIVAYCKAVWDLARLDPAEINAPYGWTGPACGHLQVMPAGGGV